MNLNILTLGGSVTWGAAIPDRKLAYPFLLESDGHHVVNLAIRATGADYPAQCIQSMLRGHYGHKGLRKQIRHQHHETPRTEDHDCNNCEHYCSDVSETVIFDIIILDFSINGFGKFELLLSRLANRYPDALFIYVDLISLQNGQFDTKDAFRVLSEIETETVKVRFPRVGDKKLRREMSGVGGGGDGSDRSGNVGDSVSGCKEKTEEYNQEAILDFYAVDRHHINAKGHALIKADIDKFISQGRITSCPKLGSWNGGDECCSWFLNGRLPGSSDNDGDSHSDNDDNNGCLQIFKGDAVMNKFDVNHQKYAIEVGNAGAVFQYHYSGSIDAPLSFQFMTKCEAGTEGGENNDERNQISLLTLYPPILVKIEQTETQLEAAMMSYSQGNIQVDFTKDFELSGQIETSSRTSLVSSSSDWTFISPLSRQRNRRQYHITETRLIGTLKPGTNYIYVQPIPIRRKRKATNPFRIVACITCAACSQLGSHEVG